MASLSPTNRNSTPSTTTPVESTYASDTIKRFGYHFLSNMNGSIASTLVKTRNDLKEQSKTPYFKANILLAVVTICVLFMYIQNLNFKRKRQLCLAMIDSNKHRQDIKKQQMKDGKINCGQMKLEQVKLHVEKIEAEKVKSLEIINRRLEEAKTFDDEFNSGFDVAQFLKRMSTVETSARVYSMFATDESLKIYLEFNAAVTSYRSAYHRFKRMTEYKRDTMQATSGCGADLSEVQIDSKLDDLYNGLLQTIEKLRCLKCMWSLTAEELEQLKNM